MTENEAIKLGKDLYENITVKANNIIPTKKYIDFVEIAIQALEEIQQYRAIGTVEEIKKVISFLSNDNDNSVIDDMNVLNAYRFIGTIEEFKALKEKNEPKKPDKDEFDRFICPDCGWIVSTEEYGGRFLPHCENCGQAIDWSE